jgi:hypothetical protein
MVMDLTPGSIHSPTVDSSNLYNFCVAGHLPYGGFCKTQPRSVVNAKEVNC